MKLEDRTIMMLVNDLSKKFRDQMRLKSEERGIVDAYRPVFFVLKKHNGCTQLDICKITQLKAPTVSLTLQKMESIGYIRREIDDDDKRNVRIYITEEGENVQKEIEKLLKETEGELLKGLDESDKTTLKALLLKMAYSVGLDCNCGKGEKK